ncbi:hypothetical protein JEM70_13495, partial [Bacillaceae bacterium HSR45]|nr:hypothetical protein [Bacillaceae bacterium HSR45]
MTTGDELATANIDEQAASAQFETPVRDAGVVDSEVPGTEGEQNHAEAVDNIDATDEMNPVGGEPTDEAPIVVPGEDAEPT